MAFDKTRNPAKQGGGGGSSWEVSTEVGAWTIGVCAVRGFKGVIGEVKRGSGGKEREVESEV